MSCFHLSICLILIVFFEVHLPILAVRYHTKGKDINKILENLTLEEIYGRYVSDLIIDFGSTAYVKQVRGRTLEKARNIVTNYYFRDLSGTGNCTTTISELSFTSICNILTRVLCLRGFANYTELTIDYKELLLDNFIGCFKVPNGGKLPFDNNNESVQCRNKCPKFIGVTKERGCFCMDNVSNLGLDLKCKEACEMFPYEPCGVNYNNVAIYTKERKQVNMQWYNADWTCVIQNSPCSGNKTGRTGFNGEIIDCNFGKGLCGEMLCTNLDITMMYNSSFSIGICGCMEGYSSDDEYNCIDIDECHSKTYECPDNIKKKCVNIKGSYNCDCIDGFVMDTNTDMCKDVNECISEPCQNISHTECQNSDGTFSCVCVTGFRKEINICQDIDECLTKTFKCEDNILQICNNTFGSYRCDCVTGYVKGSSTLEPCVDRNECLENLCDSRSTTCINFAGNYSCHCLSGFLPHSYSRHTCGDINECIDMNIACDLNTTICANVPGTYLCDCLSGFRHESRVKCQDIDECTTMQHHCSKLSTCINTIGSFECTCPEGTLKLSYHHAVECEDIDECSTKHECNLTISLCLNMQLSYRCLCLGSYVNVDNFTCELGEGRTTANASDNNIDYISTTEHILTKSTFYDNYFWPILVIGSLFAILFVIVILRGMLLCYYLRQGSGATSGGSGMSGVVSTDQD